MRRGDVVVFTWAGDVDKAMVLSALNGDILDTDQIEVFAAQEIAPLGLTAYLVEGHGIDESDLAEDAARLDALSGTLVVVPARALGPPLAELSFDKGLTYVLRVREAEAVVTAPKPIMTDSAKGNLSGGAVKPPKSDARIGGMVAMAVLVFLAVFVFLFVWSAG